MLRLASLLAVLSLGAGCSFKVSYEGSQFACSDGLCPSGFDCIAGLCEPLADDEPDAGEPPGPDGAPDAQADAAPPTCIGVDEIFDPTSGSCLALDRTPRTWLNAAAACGARGPTSHLVIITSSAENIVVAMLGGGSVTDMTWIGGTDGPTEADWRWLDGQAFFPSPEPGALAFNRWRSGEPNNGGGSGIAENCAAIQLSGTSRGLWDDRQCNDLRPSICETE